MALSISLDARAKEHLGGLKIRCGTIGFDDSYPTGGETLTPGQLGFSEEIFALIVDSAPLVCKYDASNDKLMAFWCDYDANSDGVLVQVANTTDLSSYTGLRFIAIGA